MSLQSEWKAIGARIRSLINTTNALAQLLSINSGDSYNSKGSINDQASDIFTEIKIYFEEHKGSFPETIKEVFSKFIKEKENLFSKSEKNLEFLKARITLLATLEGQVTFLISGKQEGIRRQTELAFTHLQRSIMADNTIKEKWENAFSKGETSCEDLGSLHLLQHGIWAFKANAAGGRTDLIIGEPLSNLNEVERTAYGLILTEWKIAKTKPGVEQSFCKAKKQAMKYTEGVLAGIELKNYCYLVVVTDQTFKTPNDIQEEDCCYRHIVVNIKPKVPSKH